MCKSSVDYAELAGLHIFLAHLKYPPKPDTQMLINYVEQRIKFLEQK